MSNKQEKAKPPVFTGFILSLALHLFIIIVVLFWGFSTPASIKRPDSISASLVTMDQIGGGGKKGSAPAKAIPKPPKPEAKQEVKEEVKEAPKPKPKVVEKPEPEKPKPKPQPKPKPEPEPEKVVNLKEDKKKAAPKTTPKPVAKPAPKHEEKPVAKKGPSAEEQSQDILEKMKAAKARKDVLESLKNQTSSKQVAKAGPEGYDISGSDRNLSAGTNSLIASLFADRVRSEIASNWNIPPNIPRDGTLESKVFFRIDGSGRVYDIKIEKSSGNSAFDEFCIRALKKASPLNTPPPPEILREASTDGVEVSFKNDPS